MVVKVKNDQNQTSWVHRHQLRYVPNRPTHLQPRTIVIPATLEKNSSNPVPKPPLGERLQTRNVTSGTSRIPRIIDRPVQIIQNNRRSLPIVQNRIQNVPRRRLRQSMVGPIRQPIRSIQPARPNRPPRVSLPRNRQISAQRDQVNVRRNPFRDRRRPQKFDDFVMR